MSRAWLIIAGKEANAAGTRYDLKPGLTVLGGGRADVPVPRSGNDCVHLWSEPPKLIFVGAEDAPLVNGQAALEVALHAGDRLEWRGLVASFGYEDGFDRLEEVAEDHPSPAGASRAPAKQGEFLGTSGNAAPWRWLKAGIIADLSLGDPAVIKRWQDSTARGEFDAEAASRDLLASAQDVGDSDPELTERATRLMRELLMSSVTRRPARPGRKAARSGFFVLLAQLMIFVLFLLIVLAGLMVARTRFGQSIDGHLDRIVDWIYKFF